MDAIVFSTRPFERDALAEANARAGSPHRLAFLETPLRPETAELARGHGAVVIFSNDSASREVLATLRSCGVRCVAIRAAGFNQVDVRAAADLGLTVARVPAYSPSAVAEHAVALMLCLNRKIHRAYNRVREHNFELSGLMGFDMRGKTAGVVGTGRIGEEACRILHGFGCELLGFDPVANERCVAMGLRYVELHELLSASDIVTLHCPLTPRTHHLINGEALGHLKPGAMLINTSRGAVVDTRAVIEALKSRRLGALGIDVYEEEGDLFFRDLSEQIIDDEVFARLVTFPNVLITGHQGFFTREALTNIADTTIENLSGFDAQGPPAGNLVTTDMIA